MGRRYRPHLPGGTFHLTARLHRREALFTPELRTRLVTVLREQVAYADVELFGFVVMPNHFHLVLRQGKAPLSHFMQPFLRRAALLVQRVHEQDGYVFERRYRDRPCADPDHLRNSIVYTHLNPVRAGLCADPGAYAWSSYGAWVGRAHAPDGGPHPVSLERALPLFASGPARSLAELRRDYRVFQQWRETCDRVQARSEADDEVYPLPPMPHVAHGDANWTSYLVPSTEAICESSSTVPWAAATPNAGRPDLNAIARAVLGNSRPAMDADLVRSRWGGPAYVRTRHRIIRQAAAIGYRSAQIAAYLRISRSAVSAVLTADRKRLLHTPPDA